jgi:hypothetical protein
MMAVVRSSRDIEVQEVPASDIAALERRGPRSRHRRYAPQSCP